MDQNQLWNLWKLSSKLRTRPSELLGISSKVKAFYLDRACWRFGSTIDSEIEQATQDAKNNSQAQARAQSILRKWIPAMRENVKGQFRDPAARMGVVR